MFLVFATSAGWLPPDPNEPHYLAKSRHFWDPTWCPDDYFLNSDDTHRVFYVTLGWLANVMSLPAAAWVGRVLAWALQAWGWQRLSTTVVSRPWWSILSAALFVALNEHAHMAGEWVVGGFEAKGIAYALVFFALSELLRDRWNRAWLLLGVASSFHVLVGGWSVVAAGLAWLVAGQPRPSLKTMWPGLLGGALLALPGILPALVIARGGDPNMSALANDVYVFRRLTHHLAPQGFKTMFIERHALLLCVFIMLCAFTPTDATQRRLRAFVAGAVAIAIAGFAISFLFASYPATVAALLRFYWFRLSDAMLPLGVALVGITTMTVGRVLLARTCLIAALGFAAWHLGPMFRVHAQAIAGTEIPRADGPGKVWNYDDWRSACAWIAENTPREALFLTPRSSQTFKWYAERGEVVTWKDVPQNPAQIVGWWNRMLDVYSTGAPPGEKQWFNSLADRGTDVVRRLAVKYQADYILTSAEPPLDMERVYHNGSYALYKVSPEP